MNADGTLVPPPIWIGVNVGSACICVIIPSYSRDSLRCHFSCLWHTGKVGEGSAKLRKLRCQEAVG